MGRVTARRRVSHLEQDAAADRIETLAVEEPLEIRVAGQAITVTMRTPGDDFDLAAGFLVTEGLMGPGELSTIRYCAGASVEGVNSYNVLDVELVPGAEVPGPGGARSFATTSSCGICGKASLDAVRVRLPYDLTSDDLRVSRELLSALPERLRAGQRSFSATGGVHAAGLFSAQGELVLLREDVGRHNAVDKVIGACLRAGTLPLRGSVLLVSGRASFELVQKAAIAGIPLLAAVSAPSSLAAELAAECGLTLVGFLRGSSMNVYTGAHRVG